MNYDLLKIKEKYGEKMMKLCRDLFPTLLETEGVLFDLISSNFEYSKILYEDIINNNLEEKFKEYIYSLTEIDEKEIKVVESPRELLNKAGYDLYECKTEEDIQSFRKYYKPNELLCTFRGGRLNRCLVFFAVKKNVDKIKREDFTNPLRQDEYGTSVISIQFTKGKNNILSIKNRYNHTVSNPDATFSNNLENIIAGLTQSFENNYNLNLSYNKKSRFEIPNYVKANNGKFYKYNYEINNVYYCPNNIIIDYFGVEDKYQEKEKYIIIDYFILDLVNKEIRLYDPSIEDSFINDLNNIEKIEIKKIKETKNKIITLTLEDNKKAIIEIDKENKIVSYENKNIEEIKDRYLIENKYLSNIDISNVRKIGNYCLYTNDNIKSIKLPEVLEIKDWFLSNNKIIEFIDISKVIKIGNNFLKDNQKLNTAHFYNLESVGNNFISRNKVINGVNFNNLLIVGDNFLQNNNSLKKFIAPKLYTIGACFLSHNKTLVFVSIPNTVAISHGFMYDNESLIKFDAAKLKKVGNSFLNNNTSIEILELKNLESIGNNFLYTNDSLKVLTIPKVKEIGSNFLYRNNSLTSLDLDNTIKLGNYALYHNNSLRRISILSLMSVDKNVLYNNKTLEELNAPSLKFEKTFLRRNRILRNKKLELKNN